MTKTPKSEALAAVHEMMEGLHEARSIDERAMREFDETCLAPEKSGADLHKARQDTNQLGK